ncbi:MAG: T9SS type A sorting domain-containing protein [Flavobacteriales bacterium]
MKKLITTCWILCLYIHTSAQNQPFAIWEDPSVSAYRFVQLDAATGVKTNMNVIPAITGFVSGGTHTYDPHLNRYHFAGQVNAARHFFTIEASTGNVFYSPQMNDVVVGIEYNCADSMLYGLRVNGSVYDVVTIDPVTAVTTFVGNVLFVTAYVGSSFSLDFVNGLYSFVALEISGYKLKSMNLSTGLIVHDNPFPGNLPGHVYSCADSAVFALGEVNNKYVIARINLAAGSFSVVDTLVNVTPGYYLESSSVNSQGEYTYRGFDGGNNPALITVDLSTGTVIHNSPTSDNAVGFAEPGCCADTSGGSYMEEGLFFNELNVFPVPAAEIVTITCTQVMKDLVIYDINGGMRLNISSINENMYQLNVSGLSAGLYLILSSTSVGKFRNKLLVVR